MELQRLRTRRSGGQKHRAAVLAASIFLVVIAAMAAFVFLFTQLQEMPRGSHAATGAPAASDHLIPLGTQEPRP